VERPEGKTQQGAEAIGEADGHAHATQAHHG
jgi:hypothetical protein